MAGLTIVVLCSGLLQALPPASEVHWGAIRWDGQKTSWVFPIIGSLAQSSVASQVQCPGAPGWVGAVDRDLAGWLIGWHNSTQQSERTVK